MYNEEVIIGGPIRLSYQHKQTQNSTHLIHPCIAILILQLGTLVCDEKTQWHCWGLTFSVTEQHICMRAQTCTHTHTRTYTHSHSCMHTHIRTHTLVRAHTRMHARTHARTHTRRHICWHTHTCLHSRSSPLTCRVALPASSMPV